MDTLFEGHIETTVTIKDLLRRVVQLKPSGISFLRISSANNNVEGRIFVSDGDHIIGASLSESFVSGYAALKTLLMVDLGSFALVSVKSSDKLKVDRSINIELNALLERMDSLPNELSSLFDQDSLLNRVFSANADSEGQPVAPSPLFPSLLASGEEGSNDRGTEEPSSQIFLRTSDALHGTGDAAMLAGVRELVSGRFNKAPVPSSKPPSGQLRAMSGGIHLQTKRALRHATLIAIATICLVAMASVFWKVLTPMNGLSRPQAKNIPSSPVRSRTEVSSNRAHPTGSPVYLKRLEGRANAKQRSAIEKRRL